MHGRDALLNRRTKVELEADQPIFEAQLTKKVHMGSKGANSPLRASYGTAAYDSSRVKFRLAVVEMQSKTCPVSLIDIRWPG